MQFTLEELQVIEECVKLRKLQHQRIVFSAHASDDEKNEAKREIRKIENFQQKLVDALDKASSKEKGEK